MYSPPVCPFVCLQDDSTSYRRIWTQIYGKVAHHSRTIPLNLGGDPDSRIRILNINFLKYVIAGELLVIRTSLIYSLYYSTQIELEI